MIGLNLKPNSVWVQCVVIWITRAEGYFSMILDMLFYYTVCTFSVPLCLIQPFVLIISMTFLSSSTHVMCHKYMIGGKRSISVYCLSARDNIKYHLVVHIECNRITLN